jgi:riboflavin synthase alpha subunit
MFTGLIEAVGRVAGIERLDSGVRLGVGSDVAGALRPGESVAVNGVCLTVTGCREDVLSADVGPETMRVTTLGALRVGQPVNLERAMRADSRFGGHLVQGHVDGTGAVTGVRPDGESHWLTVAVPRELEPLLVLKGSVAVEGVSLTVAALRDGAFDVMIVPFTWSQTTLATLAAGDRVNVECDMVGKYVARAAALAARGESGR